MKHTFNSWSGQYNYEPNNDTDFNECPNPRGQNALGVSPGVYPVNKYQSYSLQTPTPLVRSDRVTN